MSLPVEEVFTANGVIAPPGTVLFDFNAYPRAANVYPVIDWLYYSGAAVSGVTIFLVPAIAAPNEDRVVLASSTSTANMVRGCLPVPRNPATGLPFVLGIEKTVATNANVRFAWHDAETP